MAQKTGDSGWSQKNVLRYYKQGVWWVCAELVRVVFGGAFLIAVRGR
jgi:hypothetical protein